MNKIIDEKGCSRNKQLVNHKDIIEVIIIVFVI